jgi:hypothetical protein
MGTSAWNLREVDLRDRQRFTSEGWWGTRSVGQRMADGLAAHRDLPFVIHSRTRPCTPLTTSPAPPRARSRSTCFVTAFANRCTEARTTR